MPVIASLSKGLLLNWDIAFLFILDLKLAPVLPDLLVVIGLRSEVETATKADIQRLENRIDTLDTRLGGELTLVKWMLGAVIALAVANFAKQFF